MYLTSRLDSYEIAVLERLNWGTVTLAVTGTVTAELRNVQVHEPNSLRSDSSLDGNSVARTSQREL